MSAKATGCDTKTHKTWDLTATNQIMVCSCDVPLESVYREYERARARRDEQSEIVLDNQIPVNGVIPFNKETKNNGTHNFTGISA